MLRFAFQFCTSQLRQKCTPRLYLAPSEPPDVGGNPPWVGSYRRIECDGIWRICGDCIRSRIQIYGSSLAGSTRSWAGCDFNGVNAPTSLDGVKVTIGGQAAFVYYVSRARQRPWVLCIKMAANGE